jgi:hypothetical protein
MGASGSDYLLFTYPPLVYYDVIIHRFNSPLVGSFFQFHFFLAQGLTT